jgi:hypothetical protein
MRRKIHHSRALVAALSARGPEVAVHTFHTSLCHKTIINGEQMYKLERADCNRCKSIFPGNLKYTF